MTFLQSVCFISAIRNRLIILACMLAAGISMSAAPVKYIGCTPESGSEITNFEFTLDFDIADAIADLGAGEWGLGYSASVSENSYASLYRGTQESGTEIATALTETFDGKSEGFTVNGSKINISFPLITAPEAGQLYTVVIRNSFAIYQSGKVVPKSQTYLKFDTDPLVLTFKGGAPRSDELVLQSVSLANGSIVDTLSEIEFTFNEDIAVSDNACVAVIAEES